MNNKDQRNSMSEFDLLVTINVSLGLLSAEAMAEACDDSDITSSTAPAPGRHGRGQSRSEGVAQQIGAF